MTDKQFDRLKARIQKIFKKWRPLMGLNYFTVHLEYPRAGLERTRGLDPDMNLVARTSTSWQYNEAWIEFNMDKLYNLNDEDLEEVIVHENAHILVSEMREYKDDDHGIKHEERVVTLLEHAFIYTYKEGQPHARRKRNTRRASQHAHRLRARRDSRRRRALRSTSHADRRPQRRVKN